MHTERDFENDIETALLVNGGYIKGDPADYDAERALFPADTVTFVQATQPKIWQYLESLHKDKTSSVLIDSLAKELDSKGTLGVLREGFKCSGKTVRAAFFAPNTGMDPQAQERYQANRLSVIRQVNTRSGVIPDMVLAVNGLPVATLELKNVMSATRWTVARQESIPVRARPQGKTVCLQAALPGPFCGGYRAGVHDHQAGGQGHLLPALQSGF